MNPLAPILANVAVPMLFPQPWLMLLALVPVVGVEFAILRRRLPIRLGHVLAANLVSTLCGLPVAWCSLGVFGMVLRQDDPEWGRLGWSGHVATHALHNFWILPAAMLSVVIPCFLLSVSIEGWILAWRLKVSGWTALWGPLVRAHVFSYLLLLALDCLWFWLKLRR